MTSWTKITDVVDSFTKVGNTSVPYDSSEHTYDDNLYYDNTTQYSKVIDIDTNWKSLGGLIYLATEGARDLMMTEGETDFIITTRGSSDISWSKAADQSTSYTKVIDA